MSTLVDATGSLSGCELEHRDCQDRDSEQAQGTTRAYRDGLGCYFLESPRDFKRLGMQYSTVHWHLMCDCFHLLPQALSPTRSLSRRSPARRKLEMMTAHCNLNATASGNARDSSSYVSPGTRKLTTSTLYIPSTQTCGSLRVSSGPSIPQLRLLAGSLPIISCQCALPRYGCVGWLQVTRPPHHFTLPAVCRHRG